MLCKRPYQKIRSGIVNPILIKGGDYLRDITPFACGQCLHCRINQSRIWQTRLLLEAYDSFDSTFLTLTYDDKHVPDNYYLDKSHLTLFLKRYRKRLKHKIRYFAIGEYGDTNWRPHFHLAVFSEKRLERCVRSCEDMRKREQCTQDCIARLAWKKGNISVTDTLTQNLAAYITGYIKKKATKESRINRPNEYATQSRGRSKDGHGGIGYRAIRKIADNFAGDPRASEQVVNALNIGGGCRAIGGYLTKQLSDKLGISESVINAHFAQHALSTQREYTKGGMTIPNILSQNEGKRNSQEVKTKLFNQRQKI